MSLTPINLPTGFQVLNPQPVDFTYGPFVSLAVAKAAIAEPLRYDGLTVQITGLGNYWWIAPDFSDGGLVAKTAGSVNQDNISRVVSVSLTTLGMTPSDTEADIKAALAAYIEGNVIADDEIVYYEVTGYDDSVPSSETQDLQSVTDLGFITTNDINTVDENGDALIELTSKNGVGRIYINDTTDGSFMQLDNNRIIVGTDAYQGVLGFQNILEGQVFQLPNISGTLSEGITDGANTVHAGTDGIVDISTLLSASIPDLEEVTNQGNTTSNDIVLSNSQLIVKDGDSTTLAYISTYGLVFPTTSSQLGIDISSEIIKASSLQLKPFGNVGIENILIKADNVVTNAILQLPAAGGTIVATVNGISPNIYGNIVIPIVNVSDNFANDAAAAAGNVEVGEYYHTSGVVKIRLT